MSNSTKLLAIETAGRWGSIAVASWGADVAASTGPRSIDPRELPRDRRSAQTLAPAIETLLAEAGWAAAELDAIAVAVGPGSFTGLRVGVTTAKALAYATGARLVSVGTLDALVEPHVGETRRVWGVLDAQRGEVFGVRYDRGADATGVFRLAADQLVGKLESGDVVVGPVCESLAKRATDVGGVEWITEEPTAAAVARLGAQKLAAGDVVDPFQLAPEYHRVSAAEEKFGSG